MALLFGLLALAAIPAQAATLSTTYSDDATFESTTLAAHNVFRAEYGGVTNLVWNDTLASYATTYASASCTFAHSGGPYGENIAAGYSDATATVNAWGDEGLEYDFDTPGFTETTGHFTQIVWESTLQVGCGRVTCDGTDGTPGEFVVCEYYPAGNVVGNNNQYFIDNVLPLTTSTSSPTTSAVEAPSTTVVAVPTTSSTVEAGIFAAVAQVSTTTEIPATTEIPTTSSPAPVPTSSSSSTLSTFATVITSSSEASTSSSSSASIEWVTVTTDIVEFVTVTKTAGYTATAYATHTYTRR